MGFVKSMVRGASAVRESEYQGAAAWLNDMGGFGASTSSGVRVGSENVVTLSAVFASARAIAEDVAGLPLKAYRRLDGGGKKPAADDPRFAAPDGRTVNLYSLVHDQPCVDMDDFQHRSLLIWWALFHGNGYAEIVRNGGRAVDLPPIHPHRVTSMRDDGDNLFYRVTNGPGKKPTDIMARDMIHIRGISDDGVMGYIIPQVGADSFGVYMAAEQFAGKFFGNGATLAGVITFDHDFKTPEARKAYMEAFNATYAGAQNSNKWMLADNNAKVNTLSADPEKSQLVDTLKFRIEDAARWFRVPPVKIGHNTNTPYTNVESLNQQYFLDGMKPWAIRIEKEYTRKLVPSDDPELFVEHVIEALMWADAKTRAEVMNYRIRGGWGTPNEARDIHNMNPIPGGDQPRMESNLVLLGPDGKPEVPAEPTPPDNNSPSVPDAPKPDNEAAKAMAMPVFVDAAERMIAREAKAIAGRKNPTAKWVGDFYRSHHKQVVAAFTPAVVSFGGFVGAKVDGVAERYADSHCGESMRRLDAGEDPSTWNIDRPAWIARHLTDEVCNAHS